jgi:hypothetical protein
MDQPTMSAENKPSLTIHYLRPGFQILQPDEVEKCQEEIGHGVYKISPTIAVKHGALITFREAKNMLFIEQNTTIPVPKVYAVYSYSKPYRDENYDYTYIFMDLIPGATVEDSWGSWDEATRVNVQNELKDYISQLRGLPGGDYIGSLDRGPLRENMLRLRGNKCGTVILDSCARSS